MYTGNPLKGSQWQRPKAFQTILQDTKKNLETSFGTKCVGRPLG